VTNLQFFKAPRKLLVLVAATKPPMTDGINMASLVWGQCGTQGCFLLRAEVTALSYPLKTSLVSGKLFGSFPFAANAGLSGHEVAECGVQGCRQ
jgi:hypothetical protein